MQSLLTLKKPNDLTTENTLDGFPVSAEWRASSQTVNSRFTPRPNVKLRWRMIEEDTQH